ncbi:helix-turn-helix domain-containing protein [Paenibacillus whitsoniae]|uniref:AraC family transcriptional regulator n=1 Tax=Paenibacillus whitsoniae TaxID=2496558 RepID=A0A430JIK0_9BACL|nr:helix-turn-helix domain-containing protein [Paenibacillus whitsoniae]RTE10865.1 AraC family transcriptional regulator [Paenibacillus whitsoniae]
MEYDFLHSLSPKIMDIVQRDGPFWHQSHYRLFRERTRMHILGIVISGEGILRLGDRAEQVMRQGAIFQIWPGLKMEMTTSPSNPLCFVSIHYQYGLLQWDGINAKWLKADGPLPLGDFLPEFGTQSMMEKFKHLFGIWGQKEAGFEWEARVEFLCAIREIASALARRREVEEAGTAAIVREAIAYMKAGYQDDLTRDFMARRASLSPSYFSSIFKKHTGYSPIQYLTRIRIDKAKQLLKESRLPIKQVAEEVGFVDSFYFTRLFTRETGLTPSHYRHA